MTDNTTNQPAASKTPSHAAYQVRDRDGQKGFWTRIVSASGQNQPVESE